MTHDEFGKLRTDAFHQSAAQVFLNAVSRGRHHLLPRLALELLSVPLIHPPFAFAQQHRPCRHFQQVANQGDEVIVPLHLDFHHRIAVLGILICDALYDATEFGHVFLFLFQLLAVCKRIAHTLPQGDIAMMNRVVGDELHLLHIRLAILGKILFIYQDVHYLRHDVIAFR